MLVSNKEIDTCLTGLTWDFQPFLAVTRASGIWHVSHASGLTSECTIYACDGTRTGRWLVCCDLLLLMVRSRTMRG